jgi:predicted flavoprotein YhiN
MTTILVAIAAFTGGFLIILAWSLAKISAQADQRIGRKDT